MFLMLFQIAPLLKFDLFLFLKSDLIFLFALHITHVFTLSKVLPVDILKFTTNPVFHL